MICSVYISLCLALSPLVFLTQEVYFKKHKFNTVPNVQLKNVERSVEQQVLVSVSVSVSVLVSGSVSVLVSVSEHSASVLTVSPTSTA